MEITYALRKICGHDSQSVEGCVTCAAADRIEELERHNAYADQYNAVQDLHLSIATEALKELSCDGWEDYEMRDYARTALERIKE